MSLWPALHAILLAALYYRFDIFWNICLSHKSQDHDQLKAMNLVACRQECFCICWYLANLSVDIDFVTLKFVSLYKLLQTSCSRFHFQSHELLNDIVIILLSLVRLLLLKELSINIFREVVYRVGLSSSSSFYPFPFIFSLPTK